MPAMINLIQRHVSTLHRCRRWRAALVGHRSRAAPRNQHSPMQSRLAINQISHPRGNLVRLRLISKIRPRVNTRRP